MKNMNPNDKVVIIGGGAAGLMAAGRLAERGIACIIIDKNERVGRKIMITGKGRCNVTSHLPIEDFFPQIARNPKFLYSALYSFTNDDMTALLEQYGVAIKVERGERVFPQSDKAADVVDALRHYAMSDSRTRCMCDQVTDIVAQEGQVVGVTTQKHGFVAAKAVLIATGGASYPRTGSTGDGYLLAQQMGHTIVPVEPSLVPLVTKEDTTLLMGLSLRNVEVRLTDERGRERYSERGEMLFTHFGVSGPLILSASAHVNRGEKDILHIDLKPALTEEKLDERVLRDFHQYANKHFVNALTDLLPQKLIDLVTERSGIEPHKIVHQITAAERHALVAVLKDLTFTIVKKRPIEEAIVTRGGVSVKEVDPSTMASKKTMGLYLAGEVLDIDAYTGGFNLQIAFSTGHLAGDNMMP